MNKRLSLMLIVMLLICSIAFSATNAYAERTDVRYHIVQQIVGLDPAQLDKVDILKLWQNVYENLTRDNSDGTTSMELAESITPSEDGLTYTVAVRQGVKFHTGEEMKASDVAFSLNRALKMPCLKAFVGNITEAVAIDDYTCEIHLSAPYSPILLDLACIPIVSEKVVTEFGDEALVTEYHNQATGAYMITEYDGSNVKLKAFDEYWDGAPAIKDVTVTFCSDTSTSLIAFEAGEIDFLDVPSSSYKKIKESGKYNTKEIATNHYAFVEMNLANPILSDIRVRQACIYAVDIDAVNDIAYDGLAVSCNRIADPAFVFGAPEDGLVYEYDPDKAIELLAEAGYPDGVDLGEFQSVNSSFYPKIVNTVAAFLEDVGIHTHIVSYENAALTPMLRAGEWTIVAQGHAGTADYNFMRNYFHSSAAATQHYVFNDPKIDELFDKGAAESDPAKRAEYYAELDTILSGEAYYIPLFHKTMLFAWDKDLNFSSGPQYYYIKDWSWN